MIVVEKEVIAVFSFVIMVALVGLVVQEATPDENQVTGQIHKKAKKKLEQAVQKVKAEAKRFEKDVKEEGRRFNRRTNAEWQRFDERVGNELERFSERVEAEVNRVDENIEKLGDKAKEEWKRFIEKIKSELETQRSVLKGLAKGKICDAYNTAQKSDLYDAKKWIYDTLLPPIKDILRPHVANIVTQVAAPLNGFLPPIGNALYAIAVSPTTIDKLTEQAGKKVIREALEECG